MKIAPKTNYDSVACKNNLNSSAVKINPSFGSAGSGIKDFLTNGAAKTFKFTERGGFFLEFLIVDTFSMIAPRVIVGLDRDRDKTGQLNIQAGAEEAGRELLSGPSMNLIPMAIASIAAHKFMPAVKMKTETLEGLNHNLNNLVDINTDLTDKGSLNRKLAEKLFDDAFGGNNFNLDKKAEFKTQFVDLLEQSTKTKPKLSLMKKWDQSRGNLTDYDKAEKAFDELIIEMNNKNKAPKALNVAPDNVHNVSISTGTKQANVNAMDLFEDFHNYSKDIIEKIIKKVPKKENLEAFLKEATKKRVATKAGLAAAAFFAVGGFLLYIPKLYQLSQTSPAEQSAERAKKEALAQGGANEN